MYSIYVSLNEKEMENDNIKMYVEVIILGIKKKLLFRKEIFDE